MSSYTAPSFNDTPIQYPVQPTIRQYKFIPPVATDTLFSAINDYVDFFKMPRGAKILDTYIIGPDLDGAAGLTATVRLTDGTINKDYIAASAAFQAPVGGAVRVNPDAAGLLNINYVIPNSNFYMRVFAPAAAATPVTAAAGAFILLSVTYTMDLEYGESVLN